MKASERSICVVLPATAEEILLTLAQYISSTLCYVYKLQLLFFWLDKTERAMDHGACMCSRASCLCLVWFPDPSVMRMRGRGKKGLGNNYGPEAGI